MSTYILMKILESAPYRYDRGIRILTLGRLAKIYDRLTSYIKRGQRILDIGCGTGALTIRAARQGGIVKGIDINPQMLEIAQRRVNEGHLENVELCERGVAELDSEEAASYDVVMSGLCFSELSGDELDYTLREVKRILSPGGILIAADEVMSGNPFKRIISWMLRLPLIAITYLIAQTTTKAVKDLTEKIKNTGLLIQLKRLNKLENFVEIVARKPEESLK